MDQRSSLIETQGVGRKVLKRKAELKVPPEQTLATFNKMESFITRFFKPIYSIRVIPARRD